MIIKFYSNRIFCQDKRIELGIEKCTMLVMNWGKKETTEGIELPHQENIETFREKERWWILTNIKGGYH